MIFFSQQTKLCVIYGCRTPYTEKGFFRITFLAMCSRFHSINSIDLHLIHHISFYVPYRLQKKNEKLPLSFNVQDSLTFDSSTSDAETKTRQDNVMFIDHGDTKYFLSKFCCITQLNILKANTLKYQLTCGKSLCVIFNRKCVACSRCSDSRSRGKN